MLLCGLQGIRASGLPLTSDRALKMISRVAALSSGAPATRVYGPPPAEVLTPKLEFPDTHQHTHLPWLRTRYWAGHAVHAGELTCCLQAYRHQLSVIWHLPSTCLSGHFVLRSWRRVVGHQVMGQNAAADSGLEKD